MFMLMRSFWFLGVMVSKLLWYNRLYIMGPSIPPTTTTPWVYCSPLPGVNPTLFLFLAVVDCSEVPKHRHLCGHMQRVLRSLRHLQLHDLPDELPGEAVSQPGADAGGPGTAETPAAALLLPTLAHGRVSAFATVYRVPAEITPTYVS